MFVAVGSKIPAPDTFTTPEPEITPVEIKFALVSNLNVPLFAIAPAYEPAPKFPEPLKVSVPAEIVVLPV